MPVSFILQRSAAPTYQGPGDIVSGATAWYGLRAYSAAVAATGTQKAVNVRRASDNATQDILILTSGALDIASANTFATVDATATASATASTTLNLTGASSTPHVGSTITGTGVVQPCYIISVGSFTAGAGTVVVNAVQTLAAASISMRYALFITELYDQTGNTNHATQATAGLQPQLLPGALNLGTLPTLLGSGSTYLISTVGTVVQPLTISAVAERTSGTVQANIFAGPDGFVFNTANTVAQFYGSFPSAAATDGISHAFQAIGNGASSGINVDGTLTSASAGAGSFPNGSAGIMAQGSGAHPVTGYFGEAGIWPSAFNATQQGNMRTNQKAYWGTP